ncbi:hypothetical protein [Couchioplanes caeruleus]|uniref:Uncharacterized protein n=2 Tax=Couchioplanes caeruleus TaxID=56438 RepID=A0A1K0FIS0_9ACTN|nr:hypothetical protein [Couchioplanes caeruleus]OJF12721.1 hypothetical protein BG844_19085 [Couchioplanes caeruleus subsp. caeruleus]ROP29252.1 hypothetical protein EDD30_2038 [Couchioplanes caeruleus]
MTLWRRTRTEMAGAWRSMRYDLGRRDPEPAASRAGETLAGPGARRAAYQDVTATGFSTFGGAGVTGGLHTSYGVEHARGPRRLVAVTAFGVLAVAGATGSYVAVVNGLGSLLGEQGAEPYPLAAAAPGDRGDESNQGLGRGSGEGPVTAPEATGSTIRVLPNPAATAAAPGAPTTAAAPRPRRTSVAGTAPTTRPEPCDCLTPPVPTPTAAPSSHEPSPTPSPSASTDDPVTPTPTDSPSSTASAGSGDGGERTERARLTRAN